MGVVQYRGVISTVEDTMMHVGDILSTAGDFQYHGGYLEYRRRFSLLCEYHNGLP